MATFDETWALVNGRGGERREWKRGGPRRRLKVYFDRNLHYIDDNVVDGGIVNELDCLISSPSIDSFNEEHGVGLVSTRV